MLIGQLCLVTNFDENLKTVTVKIAPPGFRLMAVTNVQSLSWPQITIRVHTGINYKFNSSTVCRRLQFPLKMYVASTVHKVMGDTVPMLATQLTSFKKYRFWAKEQLYVLLSRVRDLSNITFVGDKISTVDCIKDTMSKEHHLLPFVVSLIRSFTQSPTNIITSELLSPFPLSCSELPNTSFGFCYLLRSLKLKHCFYIGQCKNLKRRLSQHNSGNGCPYTRPVTRRPWAVVAYVHGFTNVDNRTLQCFELDWQKAMIVRNQDKLLLEFSDYINECDVLIDLYRCNNIEIDLRCESISQ